MEIHLDLELIIQTNNKISNFNGYREMDSKRDFDYWLQFFRLSFGACSFFFFFHSLDKVQSSTFQVGPHMKVCVFLLGSFQSLCSLIVLYIISESRH